MGPKRIVKKNRNPKVKFSDIASQADVTSNDMTLASNVSFTTESDSLVLTGTPGETYLTRAIGQGVTSLSIDYEPGTSGDAITIEVVDAITNEVKTKKITKTDKHLNRVLLDFPSSENNFLRVTSTGSGVKLYNISGEAPELDPLYYKRNFKLYSTGTVDHFNGTYQEAGPFCCISGDGNTIVLNSSTPNTTMTSPHYYPAPVDVYKRVNGVWKFQHNYLTYQVADRGGVLNYDGTYWFTQNSDQARRLSMNYIDENGRMRTIFQLSSFAQFDNNQPSGPVASKVGNSFFVANYAIGTPAAINRPTVYKVTFPDPTEDYNISTDLTYRYMNNANFTVEKIFASPTSEGNMGDNSGYVRPSIVSTNLDHTRVLFVYGGYGPNTTSYHEAHVLSYVNGSWVEEPVNSLFTSGEIDQGSHPSGYCQGGMSDDGSVVAFNGLKKIFIVTETNDGWKKTTIDIDVSTATITGMCLSGNGQRIVYNIMDSDNSNQIFMYTLKDGEWVKGRFTDKLSYSTGTIGYPFVTSNSISSDGNSLIIPIVYSNDTCEFYETIPDITPQPQYTYYGIFVDQIVGSIVLNKLRIRHEGGVIDFSDHSYFRNSVSYFMKVMPSLSLTQDNINNIFEKRFTNQNNGGIIIAGGTLKRGILYFKTYYPIRVTGIEYYGHTGLYNTTTGVISDPASAKSPSHIYVIGTNDNITNFIEPHQSDEWLANGEEVVSVTAEEAMYHATVTNYSYAVDADFRLSHKYRTLQAPIEIDVLSIITERGPAGTTDHRITFNSAKLLSNGNIVCLFNNYYVLNGSDAQGWIQLIIIDSSGNVVKGPVHSGPHGTNGQSTHLSVTESNIFVKTYYRDISFDYDLNETTNLYGGGINWSRFDSGVCNYGSPYNIAVSTGFHSGYRIYPIFYKSTPFGISFLYDDDYTSNATNTNSFRSFFPQNRPFSNGDILFVTYGTGYKFYYDIYTKNGTDSYDGKQIKNNVMEGFGSQVHTWEGVGTIHDTTKQNTSAHPIKDSTEGYSTGDNTKRSTNGAIFEDDMFILCFTTGTIASNNLRAFVQLYRYNLELKKLFKSTEPILVGTQMDFPEVNIVNEIAYVSFYDYTSCSRNNFKVTKEGIITVGKSFDAMNYANVPYLNVTWNTDGTNFYSIGHKINTTTTESILNFQKLTYYEIFA